MTKLEFLECLRELLTDASIGGPFDDYDNSFPAYVDHEQLMVNIETAIRKCREKPPGRGE